MFKIVEILPKYFKKSLVVFIILNFFSAAIETLSIGLIFPLMQSLFNQETSIVLIIKNYLPQLSDDEFLKLILFFFLAVFFIKNIFLLFFKWWQAHIVNSILHNLQNSLLERYLSDNILNINRINVGVKIRNIKSETSRFGKFLLSWINLLVEVLVLFGLIILLIAVNFKVAIFCVVLFTIFATLYLFLSKKIAYTWAKKKLLLSEKSMLLLNESLKYIKDIRLFNKTSYFLNNFKIRENEIFRLSTKFSVYNSTPRLLLEIIVVIIIVFSIFFIINSGGNISSTLANIGFYSVAALRLYPASSKIFSCFNEIRNNNPSIKLLIDEIGSREVSRLETDNKENDEIIFKYKIDAHNISYKYKEKEEIFQNANIQINKGEKILIMSPSGKGKSTFLDILAGLVKVDKGKLTIDKKCIFENSTKLKKNFGYLSQDTFILNESLLFNITFKNDLNNVNINLIDEIIDLLDLNSIFTNEKFDLLKKIYENGSNLSGGQKQRIALARILYKNPDIFLLDEPTNQLDVKSEFKIIKNLSKLGTDKTIIMTSHNKDLSVLFNNIYKIEDKRFIKIK